MPGAPLADGLATIMKLSGPWFLPTAVYIWEKLTTGYIQVPVGGGGGIEICRF